MRVFVVALLVVLCPGAAVAALPSELTTDPADRAAWQTLPGVYRLDATFRVRALRTSFDGDKPVDAGAVQVSGTAFGATRDGRVVTADHLVNGISETLAIAALAADDAARTRLGVEDAQEWVTANAARPLGATLESIQLRRVGAAGDKPGIEATLGKRRAESDLAVLNIGAEGSPALPLADDRSEGTAIVAIGFGQDGDENDPTVPGVRTGELSVSGTLEGRGDEIFTQSTVEMSRGDSGGPVVDLDGRVRGMLISGAEVGSNLVPARAIEELIGRGLAAKPSPTQEAYGRGLDAFWGLDFEAAEREFSATRRADASFALAERFSERSRELREAPLALETGDGLKGFLRMLGLLSAFISLGCGLALVRHDMRRGAFGQPLGT